MDIFKESWSPGKFFIFLITSVLVTSSVAWTQMTANEIRDITPSQTWQKHQEGAILLDVRSAEEFEEGHFTVAKNIPHDELLSRLSELEEYRDREIVLFCASGRRSDYSKNVLQGHGFKSLYNAGSVNTLREHKPKNVEFKQGT